MAGFNPNSPKGYDRLVSSVENSRHKLEPFRDNRVRMLREYVGFHYGQKDSGTKDRVPVNFMELAINVYLRQLAASAPRALFTTFDPNLKDEAEDFADAVNQVLQEINYVQTHRMWVFEALVSMGMLKVGLTSGPQAELEGFLHDAGQPFADVVTLDDWVHDTFARHYEQIDYAGNIYELPFEEAMDRYPSLRRADLKPTNPDNKTEGGHPRAESLGHGESIRGDSRAKDVLELMDLWLPSENLFITLPGPHSEHHRTRNKPLLTMEYDGPEPGPYHRLSFSDVPGNVMPLPPAAVWFDLHDLGNRVFRKLGRQAERQKDVMTYRDEKDAELVKEAADGYMVRMNTPNSVETLKMGGIDQVSLAFFLQIKELLLSIPGGNLDALGGLSPQSETLGQDELLNEAASRRLADMQDLVTAATVRVIRSIAFYVKDDPIREFRISRTIPGTETEFTTRFSKETQEGDFLDFNFDIVPYSMSHSTPAGKLRAISSVIDRFIAPFVDMMAAQGISLNMKNLLRIVSEYGNLPELSDLLNVAPVQEDMLRSERARQSPNKTSTNVRVNRPGATRQGSDGVLRNALLGVAAQPSEQAAVGRSPG